MKYKEKLFRWHFLIRFSLLALLIVFLFSPTLAVIGLIANLFLFLLKARVIDTGFRNKFFGWIVFTLKSFGWSLAFCKVLAEYLFNRSQSVDILQAESEGNVI